MPKNIKDELDNFCYLIAAGLLLLVIGYWPTNEAVVTAVNMLIGACLIKIRGGANNDTSK